MYKLTQNGGITKDGTSLPAQWVNGALVELDEYSPFVIELREWIAQGNVPEAADPSPPVAPGTTPMTAAALADILIQKGVIQQTDADTARAESATLFQGPAKKI